MLNTRRQSAFIAVGSSVFVKYCPFPGIVEGVGKCQHLENNAHRNLYREQTFLVFFSLFSK